MTLLDSPTQPLLTISASIQTAAWQNLSTAAVAWWNTYLNQVCLQTILPWLQTEFNSTASEQDAAWQLVNGTAIALGSRRVILIPSRTIDTSEFQVPQEWVDLPSWAGDYYLAVQVNPDEATVWIWGYATHAQLKQQASYNPSDRTYTLDAHALIRDFDTFQLCPQESVALAPLPPVSDAQAKQLVQRLANPAILLPRLEIPFQLWGALLEQPRWRQQLGQLRLGQSPQPITQLGQWLRNAVDEHWQTLEALLQRSPAIAYQFRQTADVEVPTIQRIKVLDLVDHTVWLFVGLEPEAEGRLAVRVQLRSTEPNSILPTGVTLTLLSSTGEVVQSIVARDRDNGIQLKRFRCSIGTQFKLQIALECVTLTEDFMI